MEEASRFIINKGKIVSHKNREIEQARNEKMTRPKILQVNLK